MSAFHEVSLPAPWALGARGGPSRRTDVIGLGTGREVRNAPFAHGRRRYDVGGAMQSLQALRALVAFFEARRGKLHGFRFRDALDCASSDSGAVTATDQALGLGDGQRVVFALRKAYGAGEATYWRPIRKPQPGAVLLAVNGAPAAATVDATTGLVTFAQPPAQGASVTAGFRFDTPVRFDVDALEIALETPQSGRALSVPLIEILP